MKFLTSLSNDLHFNMLRAGYLRSILFYCRFGVAAIVMYTPGTRTYIGAKMVRTSVLKVAEKGVHEVKIRMSVNFGKRRYFWTTY